MRLLFLGLSDGLPVFTGTIWSAVSGASWSDFLFLPLGGIAASGMGRDCRRDVCFETDAT